MSKKPTVTIKGVKPKETTSPTVLRLSKEPQNVLRSDKSLEHYSLTDIKKSTSSKAGSSSTLKTLPGHASASASPLTSSLSRRSSASDIDAKHLPVAVVSAPVIASSVAVPPVAPPAVALPVALLPPLIVMAAAASDSVKPPSYCGKTDEDADSFMKQFKRYAVYREIEADDGKQLKLFSVILKESASDWLDALPNASKDTFAHLKEAFEQRYQTTTAIKYRSAKDIFARKQAVNESVDDYVTKMRRLGGLINVPDNILCFAIINGLKPYIASHVTQANPDSVSSILEAARLAELTAPAAASFDDSAICKQMSEMQSEMRRLGQRLDRATTVSVSPSRSPTPERRSVSFDVSPTKPFSGQQQRQQLVGRDSHRGGRFKQDGQRWQQQQQQPQQQRYAPRQDARDPFNQTSTGQCSRCGRNHAPHNFCPAKNKLCNFCQKPNHFAVVCRAAARQARQ